MSDTPDTDSGVHSCHANCQRPLCRMRRERDEARRIAEELSDFGLDGQAGPPLPWRSE